MYKTLFAKHLDVLHLRNQVTRLDFATHYKILKTSLFQFTQGKRLGRYSTSMSQLIECVDILIGSSYLN